MELYTNKENPVALFIQGRLSEKKLQKRLEKLTPEEISSEEELVERLMELHHKKVRCKALDAQSAKLWLEHSDEIDLCVKEILEINNKNVYALTLHMLQTIESSLKSAEDADSIVSDVEQILDVVTEEEKRDIIDAVRNNFDHYKKKLVELDPDLTDRIWRIERRELL